MREYGTEGLTQTLTLALTEVLTMVPVERVQSLLHHAQAGHLIHGSWWADQAGEPSRERVCPMQAIGLGAERDEKGWRVRWPHWDTPYWPAISGFYTAWDTLLEDVEPPNVPADHPANLALIETVERHLLREGLRQQVRAGKVTAVTVA